MSSIQAYKVHKQEETTAAITQVSKVHKQGPRALGISSQAFLNQWLHCMSTTKHLFQFVLIVCNLELISISCSQRADLMVLLKCVDFTIR